SPRVFVDTVDTVTGVGWDRAAALGPAGRFHEVRRVVSDLAVLDFETPDHRMRLRSLHPRVTADDAVGATGCELAVPDDVRPALPLPAPRRHGGRRGGGHWVRAGRPRRGADRAAADRAGARPDAAGHRPRRAPRGGGPRPRLTVDRPTPGRLAE